MRSQQYAWSCGSAVVRNALSVFGIKVREGAIRRVAGTLPPSRCAHCRKIDSFASELSCAGKCKKCSGCVELQRMIRRTRKECDAGTGEAGIINALRHFGAEHGISVTTYTTDSRTEAWQWLHGNLIHGRIAILCLDQWDHWVLAHGSGGDRVDVFDSSTSIRNLIEHGEHVLTQSRLMRRWVYNWTLEEGEKRLYAISVGKK